MELEGWRPPVWVGSEEMRLPWIRAGLKVGRRGVDEETSLGKER